MTQRLPPSLQFIALPVLGMLVLVGLLYAVSSARVTQDLNERAAVRLQQRSLVLAERTAAALDAQLQALELHAHAVALDQPWRPDRLRADLQGLQQRYPAFVWIGLADRDGTVVAATQGHLEGRSIAARPVFTRALAGPHLASFHPPVALRALLGPEVQDIADLGVPVHDRDGRRLGVLAGHVDARWFDALGDTVIGPGEAQRLGLHWNLLLDEAGRLNGPLPFAWPATQRAGAGAALRDLVLADDAQGRRHLVATAPVLLRDGLQAPTWQALVAQDLHVAQAPAREFARSLAVFAGVCALALAALGLAVTRRLARPYDRVFAALRRRLDRTDEAPPWREQLAQLDLALRELAPARGTDDASAVLLRLARDAQQLQRVLDSLPLGVAVLAPTLRAQHVNASFTALLGWTGQQASRQALPALLADADGRAALEQRLQDAVAGGPPAGDAAPPPAPLPLRRADGGALPARLQAVPLHSLDGQPDGALVVIQDLSRETEARREAQALRERLATIAETALDYAFITGTDDGRLLDWSPGAQALTGLDRAAAQGRGFAGLFDAGEREGGLPQRLLAQARAQGHARVLARMARGDGGSFIAEGTLYAFEQPREGSAWGLVYADTTPAREAARRIEESEGRLAAVISSASDAIVSTGVDGRVLLFNPAAERIFGFASAQIVGQPLDTLLPAAVRSAHTGHLQAFAASRVSKRAMSVGQVQGLRADGTPLTLEASISQAEVGGQTVLTAILRDITERHRAERALAAYQQELAGLTQRLLAQEKQTTQQLAQALHDELGQTLAAMRLIYDAGARRSAAAQGVPDWVHRLDALITAANRQVRRVLTELRPPLLDDHGLLPALDNELSHWQGRTGTPAPQMDAPGLPPGQRWPAEVEYAAFMVAREAVANAMRHAHAQRVRLRLAGGDDELLLTVEDDGVGQDDIAARAEPGHLGLVGMRERALAIGARLTLDSARGTGTQVRLHWRRPRPPHTLPQPEGEPG